jgi:hypothetical protein
MAMSMQNLTASCKVNRRKAKEDEDRIKQNLRKEFGKITSSAKGPGVCLSRVATGCASTFLPRFFF